jgi:hypothetical protein
MTVYILVGMAGYDGAVITLTDVALTSRKAFHSCTAGIKYPLLKKNKHTQNGGF